jgi:hypothetical protein
MVDRLSHSWIIAVLIIYAAIYARSLTFVYVEGDDASSVAYHALGRDAALQPPYSPYHGMMDVLLRPLPANEPTLRFVSIGLTALASPVMVMLMLTLAFRVLGLTSPWIRPVATVVLLMAVPEFFFLGLVYFPSVVSMCFMLMAHLLLLRGTSPARFAGSLALFSLGAASRWDIVTYGTTIVAHLAVGVPDDDSPAGRRLVIAFLWGILALIAWAVAVAITGYGPATMLGILLWAPSVNASHAGFSVVSVANLLSLATPAFLLLTLLGWVQMVRVRNRLALVALLAALSVLPWLMNGIPKWLLPGVPMAVVCSVAAVRWLMEEATSWKRLLVAAGLVILLSPWLIGLRATFNDSAWGPGFEMRPYDRPPGSGMAADPTPGAGAALPGIDGPRPLWGYGTVLLGWGWRSLVTARSREHRNAVTQAIRNGVPLLILQGSDGFAVATLCGMGFRTDDPSKPPDRPRFIRRRFLRPDGAEVVLLRSTMTTERLVDHPNWLIDLAGTAGTHQAVVYSYYPSNLRLLHRRVPGALTKLGPCSAFVDLGLITQSLSAP